MNQIRRIFALLLVAAVLAGLGLTTAQAQRRGRKRTSPPPVKRGIKPPRAASASDSQLTGVYHLDAQNSDDPQEAAQRVTRQLESGMAQSEAERLTRRLTSPSQLAIERRGTSVSIASTRYPRVTFEADGRERLERTQRGEQVRTRAVLYADELMVSYTGGSRENEFSVTIAPLDGGRRLRVIRRIYDARLGRPVVVQSIYNKVSNVAHWDVYGRPDSTQVAARNRPATGPQPPSGGGARGQTQPSRPVVRSRVPAPTPPRPSPRDTPFYIGDNAQFVAVLNNGLSTAYTREGDRFTMTVREPGHFEGATLEGYVSRVSRGGRISGRSEMALTFERIRLRDGRTANFSGDIESVRPVGDEEVRVDNEGGEVQERDDQTNRTVQRTAIGAAVGAIIGAIADGRKGAAIGAAIGAAAGAGSIYAQGRDDLELRSGTEIILRARSR